MTATTSVFARKRQVACDAILDATSAIIAEKGIDSFTISEVARRASINRALIYHYFQNRANLVIQAIDYMIARHESAGGAPPVESAEHTARMYIEHPEIARFIFHLLLNGRPLLRLGQRITDTIAGVERFQQEHTQDMKHDAAIGVIVLVLAELSWAFSRQEFARLLGIGVEEADERFIAYVRGAVNQTLQAMAVPPDHAGTA